MKPRISCIIPAYNEEQRIEKVLKIVTQHSLLKEVIVINDGSTDKTLEIIQKFKTVIVINQEKSLGKSQAVLAGLKKASGEIILFLDADLVGLTEENLTNLVKPVINNEIDVAISLIKNTTWFAKLIGIDYLSGQRAIKKHFLDDFLKISKIPGWGIESAYLNEKIINQNLTLKVVLWENVTSPWPQKKFGYIQGQIRLIKMVWEILSFNGFFHSIFQIFKMWQIKNHYQN